MNQIEFKGNQDKIIIVVFFTIYFIVGLLIYRDYGVSTDEPVERRHGIVTATYLVNKIDTFLFGSYSPPPLVNLKGRTVVDLVEVRGVPSLENYRDKIYGSIYSLFLYYLEQALGIGPESAGIFYLRHLVNFCLFFVAVIFFYKIARDRWDDWRLGLLAAAFLILSPRIFAESFYNNKDVAFLSVFIIAWYFLILFLREKTLRTAWWAAFFSALAVNVRIVGVILPSLIIPFYSWEIFKRTDRRIKKHFLLLGTYLLVLVFFIIILWPYLWSSPATNFLAAFSSMAHYDPGREHLGLYFGQVVSSQQLPWHYVPVWLLITTPLLYSLLFVVGLGVLIFNIIKAIKNRVYSLELSLDLLTASLFFVPLAAIIIFNSWLYNGWRQMYFMAAPFLLLGVSGFSSLYNYLRKKNKKALGRNILVGGLVVYLVFIAWQIIVDHPYQNVYFNSWAGEVENRFDRDYWGLSYRAALEYIVQHDNRPNITVSVNSAIGAVNLIMLDIPDRRRLNFTTEDKADYILTEFTGQNNCSYKDEIKSFYSGHIKIMGIYPGRQKCL